MSGGRQLLDTSRRSWSVDEGEQMARRWGNSIAKTRFALDTTMG
ncbi:hypothetical protein F441_19706 [Phytophthora nicotianae CJ01A1]|uniref:Uncharacterized protein n=6 Tax=Phytophthora nicotianae TaxID=4792 RepID=W2PLE1_PHYN3|nr:hypothetical protein PPTG_24190 [Phytophthora nicotianae INRA-310]ETI33470.1 hypothetical protein F443_19853 [Phytophthora nicotianae P1569]ETK73803.1 hypothetical protein L915_19302 [Phytophthora nicotianae]ETO62232.1 hypothetical protein F444_19841 [Phytophthora nicotianae P1976]ETP03317.1 hypothetical protein F441_19706 [Phytophthora nicotianae CJ01A1]ETP31479.1 hypothetical protein F442_19660 [Phytophthora nicotianae P10297]